MPATIAVPRRVRLCLRGASSLAVRIAVSFVLLSQSAAAQTRAFQESGVAEIRSDSLAAREAACAAGIRSAVQRAIESILGADGVGKNKRDIDGMLANATRYAQRTEILQEGPEGREYRCRVRVTVDTGLLTKDIGESPIDGPPPGPRVMVIIDEYRLDRPDVRAQLPDAPPIKNGSAAAALMKLLRDKNYQVVDEEFAREIRQQRIGVMREFMADSSGVAELAKELGRKRSAGWLILGGVKAAGKEASGKRFVAEATMAVRVVNTSDGAIIASEEGTKSVEETSLETALSEAAASVTRAGGENIAVQISRYLQTGSTLALNLYKVSDAQIASEFEKYLKSLAGVTRVQELNFDGINGLLELNVTFRGTPSDFRNVVLEQAKRQPQFRQLQLRQAGGSALDFVHVPAATLAFDIQLDDKILRSGDRYNIHINVNNTGSAPANNVLVRLSGDSALVSAAGSQKAIGNIAPGQGQSVDFTGVVPQQAQPRNADIRVNLREGAADLPESKAVTVALVPNTAPRPAQPQPDEIKRRLFVLAIGISKYQDSSINLANPAGDAQKLSEFFASQRGLGLYEEVTVKLLVNNDANRERILKELNWLTDTPRDGDVRILFLSGHGVMNRSDYYFAGYGYNSPDNTDLTSISWFDISRRLGEAAGNSLLIVDTCHSGGIVGTKGLRVSQDVDDMLKKYAEYTRRFVTLAASTSQETVPDDSVFFKTLLKGLTEGPSPGKNYVDLLDLWNYILAEVEKASNKQQHVISSGLKSYWPIAALKPQSRRQ